MTFESLLWILIVLISVALLFLMVYFLLAFDELKHDHKNPTDVCNSLNPWVLPEYGAHALLTMMLLFNGSIFGFFANIILVLYHAHRYSKRPVMRAPGIYEATEILNGPEPARSTQEAAIKLAFYMVGFFFYLYSMMYVLLASD